MSSRAARRVAMPRRQELWQREGWPVGERGVDRVRLEEFLVELLRRDLPFVHMEAIRTYVTRIHPTVPLLDLDHLLFYLLEQPSLTQHVVLDLVALHARFLLDPHRTLEVTRAAWHATDHYPHPHGDHPFLRPLMRLDAVVARLLADELS